MPTKTKKPQPAKRASKSKKKPSHIKPKKGKIYRTKNGSIVKCTDFDYDGNAAMDVIEGGHGVPTYYGGKSGERYYSYLCNSFLFVSSKLRDKWSRIPQVCDALSGMDLVEEIAAPKE